MRILLLAALFALTSVVPGQAQIERRPSKPLDLLATARVSRAVKPPGSSGLPSRGNERVPVSARSPEGGLASSPVASTALAAGNAATVGSVRGTGSERATTQSPKSASSHAGPAENDAALFCSNVADAAADARLAWQMRELEKAESSLRQRITELEAKRAEYEKWLTLRDDFLKKAEGGVVEIYSRMRPEAAAAQIAGMTDETAAAVLAKLTPKNSSAIFNEMDAARAAHLADMLGGMRRVEDGKTSK